MKILLKIIKFIGWIWLEKMAFPLFDFVADRCNPMFWDIWAAISFCVTAAIIGAVLGQILGIIIVGIKDCISWLILLIG